MRRARKGSGVISLRFNQDQGCFTCCMDTGLRIYNVDPLAEKARYTREEVGDIIICEMLYRTNILFMVRSSQDKVLQVYDDAKSKFIAEITFNSTIKAVRLRKDRIAVVLEQCIQVLRWPSVQRTALITTPPNMAALCALPTAPAPTHLLLAAPGHKLGSVQVVDLQMQACSSLPPHHVHCHRGTLASLAMSANGALLATASSRGTLIRIWDMPKGNALVELRRGADQSTLYCLSFSGSGELVCCVSDKGTLHVWSVRSPGLNRRSSLAALGALGGGALASAYAASQWALATATLPPDTPAQCALLKDTAVVAVCKDGSYHKYIFSQDGLCRRDSYDIFLQVGDDDDFIV